VGFCQDVRILGWYADSMIVSGPTVRWKLPNITGVAFKDGIIHRSVDSASNFFAFFISTIPTRKKSIIGLTQARRYYCRRSEEVVQRFTPKLVAKLATIQPSLFACRAVSRSPGRATTAA
jgi:hypothetical protein